MYILTFNWGDVWANGAKISAGYTAEYLKRIHDNKLVRDTKLFYHISYTNSVVWTFHEIYKTLKY
jgi:hypothetical protein